MATSRPLHARFNPLQERWSLGDIAADSADRCPHLLCSRTRSAGRTFVLWKRRSFFCSTRVWAVALKKGEVARHVSPPVFPIPAEHDRGPGFHRGASATCVPEGQGHPVLQAGHLLTSCEETSSSHCLCRKSSEATPLTALGNCSPVTWKTGRSGEQPRDPTSFPVEPRDAALLL